ncbi:MAG: hypothetical protein WED81_02475 [Rhodothermales bacterium]
MLTGCGKGREEPEAVTITPLYFEPIGYGQNAALSDTTIIAIRDEATWKAYQDSLRPIAPFDSVDFSQAIVLLSALPQTTSGFIIEFVSVEERDSVTVAEYVVNAPGSDCLTGHTEAVPFQAVLVRRTNLPVQFQAHTEEYRCTFGPPR